MAPSGTARRLLIDEKRRSVRQRYAFIVTRGTRDSAFSPTETSALPGFIDGFGEEERKQTEKGEWKRGGFGAKRGAFDQNPPLFSGKFPAFAPYTATERSESG